jgi:hypothetical protein
MSTRTKRILGNLAIAIILSGGCISLVSLEPNPTKWPAVLRPIFVLVSFLFFQWFDKGVGEKTESEKEIDNYREKRKNLE